ncbi:MAG: thiamine phosphate synthase [Vulcanimicrobiaceae bacterium]
MQLRSKAGVERSLVRAMHVRTAAVGARLIVNDDLDAALDADGWHGGQEDLATRSVAEVRRMLGSRLLGISCGTPEEARLAQTSGADYVGTGPFAATTTKPDAGVAIGIAGVAAVVAAVDIPVVAIGGIDETTIGDAVRSGARMAAIVSAIARATDPEAATLELARAWNLG